MVKVSLTSSLRNAAGGEESIEIDAHTVRDIFAALVAQYPRMQQHLDAGIAVAIDGQIYRDNWQAEIPENAEVFLLPRIKGG